jgi:hypothetical protein
LAASSAWQAGGEALSPTSGSGSSVFWIVFAMVGIVALAGVILVYVAFPHRGRAVPKAGWVGDTMERGVHKLPTLDNRR